jgi:hypothetical protein
VLLSLALPIILSAVALFFASFLSWMVLPFHRKDWVKLDQEDEFLAAARQCGLTPGNYMFPGCNTRQEMSSPEHQAKWEAGPRGVITVFDKVNMGRNLGLTFLLFLAVSFTLGYLATLALPPGADFMSVLRVVSTAGLLAFLPAMVLHAIWFHCRIVGHVLESIAFALIVGAIFGALWPGT